LKDEGLADRSLRLGTKLLEELRKIAPSYITDIRGRGLMIAIEMDPGFSKSAWEVCLLLAKKGILCKPTHDNIIRLAPPLVITDEEVDTAIRTFKDAFLQIEKGNDIPVESDFAQK